MRIVNFLFSEEVVTDPIATASAVEAQPYPVQFVVFSFAGLVRWAFLATGK